MVVAKDQALMPDIVATVCVGHLRFRDDVRLAFLMGVTCTLDWSFSLPPTSHPNHRVDTPPHFLTYSRR